MCAACTNAYDYGDPVCVGNSTLYWGTGNHSDLSCAHCVCDEGWSGADCGRCDDISVCPSKMTVDGEVSTHTRDAEVEKIPQVPRRSGVTSNSDECLTIPLCSTFNPLRKDVNRGRFLERIH